MTSIISAGFPVTLPVRVKAHLCLPPQPFTHTLYQQVFEWRRLSSSLPLGSTRHVASAHLLLSMFSLLLFTQLLMFSDTSSCNTSRQPVTSPRLLPKHLRLSPAAPPALSLLFCVSELLLNYLAPTPAHKCVGDIPFLCLAGNTKLEVRC